MGVLRLIGGVAAALLVLAAVALQGACTANKSPLASASPLEKQFAAAAITWDLNQDGDVTCAEWKQYAAQLFREADRNRDGYLNREEYSVMARTDRLFETAGLPTSTATATAASPWPRSLTSPIPPSTCWTATKTA